MKLDTPIPLEEDDYVGAVKDLFQDGYDIEMISAFLKLSPENIQEYLREALKENA